MYCNSTRHWFGLSSRTQVHGWYVILQFSDNRSSKRTPTPPLTMMLSFRFSFVTIRIMFCAFGPFISFHSTFRLSFVIHSLCLWIIFYRLYTKGFRFSLAGDQPCLNFYFPGWRLDSKLKFGCAMMVIVLLAILTEGISRLRFQVQHAKPTTTAEDVDVDTDHGSSYSLWFCGCCNWLASDPSRKRNVVTILHGVQAWVGYVLMLATMTYSLEFLFSVVVGLGIGYTLFYNEQDNHVTTNPCCNFMQGEADERAVTLLEHQQQQQRRRSSSRGVEDEEQQQSMRRVVADGSANSGWTEDAPLLSGSVANNNNNATSRTDSKRYRS